MQSAWQCAGCGRVANSSRRPPWHIRDGQHCGPFAPAVVAPDGTIVSAGPKPILSAAGDKPFRARQSTLRGLSECPRREWHSIQAGEDSTRGNVGSTGDLGTAVHAVAAEILRTLWEQNATEMPQQEAVEIAMEVLADLPFVLPADEADDFIDLTIRFVTKPQLGPDGRYLPRPWRVDKLMTMPDGALAIEQRIEVPIVCQDGVTRILSCQPDAIFAAGAGTLVVPDWKSGKGTPKEPKQHDPTLPEEVARGKRYLSERGHFQGDTYSLAALHRFPGAERVLFRELHLRSGKIREAFFDRSDVENTTRLLGDMLMKLERGLLDPESRWGQRFWAPKPGAACTRSCSVARSCPIPAEQRGVGALETNEDADAEAARLIQIEGLRGEMLAALKTRWNEVGYAGRVGDEELRWDGGKGGARQMVSLNGNGGNGA